MGWETWVITTLSRSLAYGTPLLLGTLGEIYAERSGVLNLGVEGMMIMGAYSAFTTAYISGNPWLGILVGAAVGGAFSLIHAFTSVTLKASPCSVLAFQASWDEVGKGNHFQFRFPKSLFPPYPIFLSWDQSFSRGKI